MENKITYSNECTNAYSSQTNMEAGIYVNGTIVGYIEYVIYFNELTISHIFIDPTLRRKGYASRLLKYVLQENPNKTYISSLKTDLGSKFIKKDLPLTESLFQPKQEKDIIKLFDIFSTNRVMLIQHYIDVFQANSTHQKYFNLTTDINLVKRQLKSKNEDLYIINQKGKLDEAYKKILYFFNDLKNIEDTITILACDFRFELNQNYKCAGGLSYFQDDSDIIIFNKPYLIKKIKDKFNDQTKR